MRPRTFIAAWLGTFTLVGSSDMAGAQEHQDFPSAEAQEPAGAISTAAIPTGRGVERYAFIWEKSPFTLSSAAEEPVAGFSANLVLVGHGVIGGKAYARIMDKATQQRFTVAEGEPSNGIELVSVEASNDPLQSVARLRKGDETGVIRFDPAMLTAAVAAQPVPQPNAVVPQPPGVPPTAIQQPGQSNPGNQIPAPRRRRIIIPSSR